VKKQGGNHAHDEQEDGEGEAKASQQKKVLPFASYFIPHYL
jgi:hypothetical protein